VSGSGVSVVLQTLVLCAAVYIGARTYTNELQQVMDGVLAHLNAALTSGR
jgi:hypothetical protein